MRTGCGQTQARSTAHLGMEALCPAASKFAGNSECSLVGILAGPLCLRGAATYSVMPVSGGTWNLLVYMFLANRTLLTTSRAGSIITRATCTASERFATREVRSSVSFCFFR